MGKIEKLIKYVSFGLLFFFMVYIVFESRKTAEISTYYNTSLLADNPAQGMFLMAMLLHRYFAYGIIFVLGLILFLCKVKVTNYILQGILLTSFWMRMYRLYVDFRYKWYRLNEYEHQLDYHLVILLFIIAWAFYLYFTHVNDYPESRASVFIRASLSALVCGMGLFFSYSIFVHHIWLFYGLVTILFIVASMLTKYLLKKSWRLLHVSIIIEYALYVVLGLVSIFIANIK